MRIEDNEQEITEDDIMDVTANDLILEMLRDFFTAEIKPTDIIEVINEPPAPSITEVVIAKAEVDIIPAIDLKKSFDSNYLKWRRRRR